MSGTLDHWVDGSPAVGSAVNSTRFDYWLAGAPVISLGSSVPQVDAGFILAQALWSSGDRPGARAAASAARADLLQAKRLVEVANLSAWSRAHP